MRRKRLPIWKKIILIVVCVVLIIVLLFILLIAVLTFTEYKPADTEKLDITGTAAAQEVTPGDEISVLTWNIGYGALGSNADFFMDGGDGVRTADQDRVNENMQGMLAELGEVDPDIPKIWNLLILIIILW